MMSSLGHFRLGKIDSKLVRESVIKIRVANCGTSVIEAERSEIALLAASLWVPVGSSSSLFSFSLFNFVDGTSVISKNVATKLAGLTLAWPAGRLKVAEYSSRAECALAR